MYTVSDIITDINRGILANNMVEDRFLYRIVFYINENGRGTKHYTDASYENLRQVLENIIRENLTTSNTVVLAAVTTRKNGETISLLSRAYSFSLGRYFEQIAGRKEKEYTNSNYGRRKVNWC